MGKTPTDPAHDQTGTPVPVVASRSLRVAGWVLHLYTASGSVLALLAVVAAFAGDTARVLWILLAAIVIDGTDGLLARRLRVKETLPHFDGARLDDIVDYMTYVFVPVVLLWNGGFLPAGSWGAVLAALPLLASSYQFCRTDAKTEDHFFLGFPSYWNVVAFYVVVLDLDTVVTAAIVMICVILVFVPVKYLYPSRATTFRELHLGLAALWLALYAIILIGFPDPHPVAVGFSLAYVGYYVVVSVHGTVTSRRGPGGRAGARAGVSSTDV